jgi:anti-sigma regulatory factor (Ser/Thr protein kinase)
MDVISARQAFEDIPEIDVISASPAWICLRITPRLSLREKIANFFRDFLAGDLPAELAEQLVLAFDELLTNAIEHGRAKRKRVPVTVTYIRTTRSIVFHLRDGGPGFALESMDHAAVNNPPDDPLRHAEYRSQLGLRPGGFGILLVKQIADELIYNEFGNEALFIKYL